MRTLAVPAIALIAAIMLAGCSLFSEQRPIPTAAVEYVDVPDGMLPQLPEVDLSPFISPASDHHPWLVGGIVTAPGALPFPAYWSSADGEEWEQHKLADVSADLTVLFRGSPELVALGGIVWNEGLRHNVLWRSMDGETWDEVALSENFRNRFPLIALAVDGETIVAIGEDLRGRGLGVHITGGRVTEFALPKVPADDFNTRAVALDGERIVLIASPGSPDQPANVVSFVSPDLGATWSVPLPVAESSASVSGVTAVENGFVATGGALGSHGYRDGAAWFSPDGKTWTVEAVPHSEHPWLKLDSYHRDLGVPTESDGVVGAMLGHPSSLVNAAFRRSIEGKWESVGATTPNDDRGASASVVFAGDQAVGLVTGHGGTRIGSIREFEWHNTQRLSEREDLVVPRAVRVDASEVVIDADQVVFTADETFWQWKAARTSFTLDEGSLAEVPHDLPKSLAGQQRITRDGTQFVLGSDDTTNAPLGWFRSRADAEWTEVSGLPQNVAVNFNGVAYTEDIWMAFGSTDGKASVYASTDGKLWSTSSPSSDSPLYSEIESVCEFPDGTPVAFGVREHDNSENRANAWVLTDTGWEHIASPPFARAEGWAAECATTPEGVVVRVQVGSDTSLYLGTAKDSWTKTMSPPLDSWVAHPTVVDGGFAATGYFTEGKYASPVVWLSSDLVRWAPVAVPSARNGSVQSIAASGDDLLILMAGTSGHPVMIVRDIAELIDSTSRHATDLSQPHTGTARNRAG